MKNSADKKSKKQDDNVKFDGKKDKKRKISATENVESSEAEHKNQFGENEEMIDQSSAKIGRNPHDKDIQHIEDKVTFRDRINRERKVPGPHKFTGMPHTEKTANKKKIVQKNKEGDSFTEMIPEKSALLVIRGTASTMDWSINMDDLGQVFSYRTGELHIDSDEERREKLREEEIEYENEKNKLKCTTNKGTDQTERKEDFAKIKNNDKNEEIMRNIEIKKEKPNSRRSQNQTNTEEKKNKLHRQEVISGL